MPIMNKSFPSYLSRIVLFSVLTFIHLAGEASCSSGWLEAETSKFLLWVANDGECHDPLVIRWWVKKIIDGKPTVLATDEQTVVPFDQQCTVTSKDGKPIEFTCKPEGGTPISGAKYKRIRTTDYMCTIDGNTFPLPAYAYECIDGCNEDILKTLKEEVEACD